MSTEIKQFSGAGLPYSQPPKPKVSFFANLREPRASDDPRLQDVIGKLTSFVLGLRQDKANVSSPTAGCPRAARPTVSAPPIPKDPERVAFENMAADFEKRTRLKVNVEDSDDLLRDPAVNEVLRDRAAVLIAGMNDKPMRPPANDAERAADQYLAHQVAKVMGPENRAKEEFEAVSARMAEKFGVRFN